MISNKEIQAVLNNKPKENGPTEEANFYLNHNSSTMKTNINYFIYKRNEEREKKTIFQAFIYFPPSR